MSLEKKSQKQAFRENRDSDRSNKGFEFKSLSANVTVSGLRLLNLQMIIFIIFSHFRMTEYINIRPEGTLSVCVSVCVCLCLSVEAIAPKRLDGF